MPTSAPTYIGNATHPAVSGNFSAMPGISTAIPCVPTGLPNFAFGQVPSTQTQDPAAQVLMLQQMAAHLSMQAAMLQAGQGNGWPAPLPTQTTAQSPPQPHAQLWAQPPAQWTNPQNEHGVERELHRWSEAEGQKIPVELSVLTREPFHPEIAVKNILFDSMESSKAPFKLNHRHAQSVAGNFHDFAAEQSLWNSSIGDWTPPSEPAKLPTDFTSDPRAFQMTSMFDAAKSPHGALPQRRSGWTGGLPMLEETEESSPSHGDRQLSGEKRLQDTPMRQGLTGIKVKNTFLDFQLEERPAGMRAVQTFSGSLSLMTGLEDDDEE